MAIRLRPYQQKLVDDIHAGWGDHRSVLAVLSTGGGKCLAKDTPVLMYDGRVKNVQDVKTGDLLMGPDSTAREVLSTCSGREEMYRVTPIKGDPYTVNASHILSLKVTGSEKVVNIEVRDYLKENRNFKHIHKGWRAPVNSWPSRDFSPYLPPYMLGLWLGDGHSRHPSLTTGDQEVAHYLYLYATQTGQEVRAEYGRSGKAATFHISANFRHTDTMREQLRKRDLILNKHVPHDYKTASRQQRLELLAGLLDSDGHYNGKCFDVVFKSKTLADDLAFLARSLGFATRVKECRKTCTNTGATGTYYRQCISGDLSLIPCRLTRHQCTPRRQKKDVLKTGLKVDAVGVGDYYGFEIDGDRLFMLGDFTVTHNTVCFSSIIQQHNGAAAAVVHRKEIVGQIALSLARLGIKHRVIAPPATVRIIRRKQLEQLGQSFVDPNALVGVVSVQTLTSKSSKKNAQLQAWVNQVRLCVYDEGHHYVKTGLWAKAVEMLHEDTRLLFVTATPERADGKGLGVDADGFAQTMLEGPTTKWLIDEGFLSPFRYYAPDTDLDVSCVALTAKGDFNAKALRARVVESHLVGDSVGHYHRFAPGKRAIVFAVDVATAEEMAAAFQAQGYTAAALSGSTDQGERDRVLAQFEAGTIQVLVNVDLFDEGFDVPAVEVVIMARPTQSLAKFLQMIGRGLRIMDGKDEAIVIDPVRNWERHGMPDWPRHWSLAGKEKGSKSSSDTIPQRVCIECTQPYEAYHKACPYCGAMPEPAGRSLPEQVDGDLQELDVDAMAALFEKMQKADCSDEEFQRDLFARHVPPIGHAKQMKSHRVAKHRRQVLRELVGWWVGAQTDRDLSEVHRRFFHRFGVDIATAFTLNAKDTDALADKISSCFALDTVLI